MKIVIREETFLLLPERALFWPTRRSLVVADFHLGKSETFQQSGFALPPQAQREDLHRLENLIATYDANEVLFLGDLVHSKWGVTEVLVTEFQRWMSRYSGRLVLVAGNHDRDLVRAWPPLWERIEIVSELIRGRFSFCHDPPKNIPNDQFFWSGHIHPQFRLRRGADHLRLPCFALSPRQGILPAFSSLAGGADVKRRAGWQLYPIGDDEVFAV